METKVQTRQNDQSAFKWLTCSMSVLACLLVLLTLSVVLIDRMITWQTQDSIYHNIVDVPNYNVAMVLGTSKYLTSNKPNAYYTNRIDAAIRLYQLGKVKSLLLSGDNAHRSYNEPWTMKRDLLKAGIAENSIHLDYAGFRTLDSIMRAKEVFLEDHFLIITQNFHCERALYIAQYHDINAQCLAVPGPGNGSGMLIRFREVFARTKAFLDLYILNAQPKFLGPVEPIPKSDDKTSPP